VHRVGHWLRLKNLQCCQHFAISTLRRIISTKMFTKFKKEKKRKEKKGKENKTKEKKKKEKKRNEKKRKEKRKEQDLQGSEFKPI